jgi:hypothetical protein
MQYTATLALRSNKLQIIIPSLSKPSLSNRTRKEADLPASQANQLLFRLIFKKLRYLNVNLNVSLSINFRTFNKSNSLPI